MSCDGAREACIETCEEINDVAEECEEQREDTIWDCAEAALGCAAAVGSGGTVAALCVLITARCVDSVGDVWDCEEQLYDMEDRCLENCDEYHECLHRLEYWHGEGRTEG